MEDIFILRHGLAEELGENQAKTDFDRKLTEEGKDKINKLGLFFDKTEENITLVLSSPYLRAKETAEIFTNSLDPKPELKIVEFLSPGSSSKEIAKGLVQFSSHKKVLIVGHIPDLELFLGKLISAERIKLKKGALAKVSLENAIELSGELVWLITPKLIRKFKLKEKQTTANNN